MRSRIAQLRSGLVEALTPFGLAERFAHINQQRGMFSYTGLSTEQVQVLREQHSVYMVGSGRANMAGVDGTRLELLAKAGGNPFMSHQVPQAIIALKQGAGRLIRSETDRGVLMICDTRLIDKPYGRRIWQSLPPMRRSRVEQDVVDFLLTL